MNQFSVEAIVESLIVESVEQKKAARFTFSDAVLNGLALQAFAAIERQQGATVRGERDGAYWEVQLFKA